jgi:hypothetical protein
VKQSGLSITSPVFSFAPDQNFEMQKAAIGSDV